MEQTSPRSPAGLLSPSPWPAAMLDDFVANPARHAPPKHSWSKEPEEKIKLSRKNNNLIFSAPGDQVRPSHIPYCRSAKRYPRKALRNDFSRSCFRSGNWSNVVSTRCKTCAHTDELCSTIMSTTLHRQNAFQLVNMWKRRVVVFQNNSSVENIVSFKHIFKDYDA